MSAGKRNARSYFSQIADPAPQGEPVFTARRGGPARVGQPPVEAPIIEDVVESRSSAARVRAAIQRKPLGIQPGAVSSTPTRPVIDAANTNTGRASAPERRSALTPMPPYRPVHTREERAAKDVHGSHTSRREPETHRETLLPSSSVRRVESFQPRAAQADRPSSTSTQFPLAEGETNQPRASVGETNPAPTTQFAMPVQRETPHARTISRRELPQSELLQQLRRHDAARVESDTTAPRKTIAEEPARNRQVTPRESASSNGNRKTGPTVRIGTIEVRISSPPPPAQAAPPQAFPEMQSKRAESHLGPRPMSRDSLSNGLAWNYGLIQG